jgi:hypothetical protein
MSKKYKIKKKVVCPVSEKKFREQDRLRSPAISKEFSFKRTDF